MMSSRPQIWLAVLVGSVQFVAASGAGLVSQPGLTPPSKPQLVKLAAFKDTARAGTALINIASKVQGASCIDNLPKKRHRSCNGAIDGIYAAQHVCTPGRKITYRSMWETCDWKNQLTCHKPSGVSFLKIKFRKKYPVVRIGMMQHMVFNFRANLLKIQLKRGNRVVHTKLWRWQRRLGAPAYASYKVNSVVADSLVIWADKKKIRQHDMITQVEAFTKQGPDTIDSCPYSPFLPYKGCDRWFDFALGGRLDCTRFNPLGVRWAMKAGLGLSDRVWGNPEALSTALLKAGGKPGAMSAKVDHYGSWVGTAVSYKAVYGRPYYAVVDMNSLKSELDLEWDLPVDWGKKAGIRGRGGSNRISSKRSKVWINERVRNAMSFCKIVKWSSCISCQNPAARCAENSAPFKCRTKKLCNIGAHQRVARDWKSFRSGQDLLPKNKRNDKVRAQKMFLAMFDVCKIMCGQG